VLHRLAVVVTNVVNRYTVGHSKTTAFILEGLPLTMACLRLSWCLCAFMVEMFSPSESKPRQLSRSLLSECAPISIGILLSPSPCKLRACQHESLA